MIEIYERLSYLKVILRAKSLSIFLERYAMKCMPLGSLVNLKLIIFSFSEKNWYSYFTHIFKWRGLFQFRILFTIGPDWFNICFLKILFLSLKFLSTEFLF